MKKIAILFVSLITFLACGCESNFSSEGNSNLSDIIKTEPVIKADTTNLTEEESSNSSLVVILNPYFIDDDSISLNGSFLFDDDIEKEVALRINQITTLKEGRLFELKIDPIEGIPDDRLNLGYFYEQKDKIIRILPTEENLKGLKNDNVIPPDSVIVCQGDEIKDKLSQAEKGWHQYIEINADKCEFHSYNNQVDTGYYESFTWEKNKGLVYYQSGYGAGRDSIELQR